MQKSRNATIGVIVFIFLYDILANCKLITNFNHTYLYIINPLFWIIIAIFLKIILGKSFEKQRLKKEIIQYTIIAALVYILTYIISGLIITFGKNPYATNLVGVITNFWISGTVIIAQEYIRYRLIHNVYKKDEKLIAILLSAVYIVINIEFVRYTYSTITILYIAKEISQRLIPMIAKNILFSYTAINSSYEPAIYYELLTHLFLWSSPIFPNAPWIMVAIIETVIPVILFLYIRYYKNKKDMIRTREKETEDENPTSLIPVVILVILAIWFAIGIFPIKPVAVASGSMEDELFVGDVAVIKKCNANDIEVGDIIEYQMEGYTIIHRVIEKKQRQGQFYFTTKGDNNNSADSKEVTEEQLIGKVIFKVKYLGYPAIWLHMLQSEQQIEVETGN